ncbi:hypothetical protein BO70DRAFT_362836 [Aspergillus heteromorphus CBS 117.55]|uniref:Uncharacterized protein n=1 Tax=Aspergillus heteromorphus CBS 117.55 TaxID=1448321 RepID=A0A317W3I3_9EURO|nr:uncharacterized protein BO70DRAFT_362836 [Aspergillus heteromorphus CBS 117.55]PWY79678.1 hypothetical protein BO70DRAFT_362836 [Aspergillus heteromorphus CBS 117.55]
MIHTVGLDWALLSLFHSIPCPVAYIHTYIHTYIRGNPNQPTNQPTNQSRPVHIYTTSTNPLLPFPARLDNLSSSSIQSNPRVLEKDGRNETGEESSVVSYTVRADDGRNRTGSSTKIPSG